MRRILSIAALSALVACSPASADQLPDARLTPGVVLTENGAAASTAQICVRGYARSVRPPYDYGWRRFRVAVFARYGIPHYAWRGYTLDHEIPLELGGAPESLFNVWPEPKQEAKRKDAVENALREAVCNRNGFRGVRLSLAEAQREIARDWTRTAVGKGE